jgi:hypothetical protein
MATRLEGWAAIAFAERSGCLLCIHAGGGEPARDGVSVDEARRVAASRPDRVYVDFDPEGDGGSRVA